MFYVKIFLHSQLLLLTWENGNYYQKQIFSIRLVLSSLIYTPICEAFGWGGVMYQ
jgi:hypothetical protein